jgi:hypothetical protein
MQYHFLSAVDLGLVPDDDVVSNHRPLSRLEIAGLLAAAQSAALVEDWFTFNSVQIRLCQGIVGYISPRPRTGVIAETEHAVSALFLDRYQDGADPAVINQLYDLMNQPASMLEG